MRGLQPPADKPLVASRKSQGALTARGLRVDHGLRPQEGHRPQHRNPQHHRAARSPTQPSSRSAPPYVHAVWLYGTSALGPGDAASGGGHCWPCPPRMCSLAAEALDPAHPAPQAQVPAYRPGPPPTLPSPACPVQAGVTGTRLEAPGCCCYDRSVMYVQLRWLTLRKKRTASYAIDTPEPTPSPSTSLSPGRIGKLLWTAATTPENCTSLASYRSSADRAFSGSRPGRQGWARPLL